MVEGDLILGRFLVGERIGQGGFGVVHSAWDQRLERAVAVKEIVAGDEQRVQREAQAAARLNHPGIVTLYELGREGSRTYLVSELVEGTTLRELIDDGSISDRDVGIVGSELCYALAHAHARGVVHRDIKPENVIVAAGEGASGAGRGQVKLMDFGIAAIAGAPTLTATGQMVGTIAYIAPEQADGAPSGPEGDVYALALNLYECWSGHNPVARETPAATARAIGSEIPALGTARPDLPRDVAAIVDACLDREPYYRPSLAELRATLRDVADSLEGAAPVPVPVALDTSSSSSSSDAVDRRADPLTIPAVLATAGLAAGLALIGFGGTALVVAALIAPAALFVRSPRAWLLPALAPALASIGLAPLYVVAAGLVGRSTLGRLALGALGVAWLIVAAVLLGLPASLSDLPRATGWADSGGAAVDALRSTVTAESISLAVVWAVGAATLGALVSLRVVGLRPVLALVWAAVLLAAHELVYGATAAGAAADGGLAPLALAAAVLGAVAVTVIRQSGDHHGRRSRSPSATTAEGGRQPRAVSPAAGGIRGRGLDPPVP